MIRTEGISSAAALARPIWAGTEHRVQRLRAEVAHSGAAVSAVGVAEAEADSAVAVEAVAVDSIAAIVGVRAVRAGATPSSEIDHAEVAIRFGEPLRSHYETRRSMPRPIP
jgi:hypothetical protein